MKYGLLIPAFMVVGCAQMFPAAYKELDEGKYWIQATGNAFATPEQLSAKVEKRASQLCGEGGYVHDEPAKLEGHTQKTYSGTMVIEAGYSTFTSTVKCNDKNS